ncbi:hypothetical protein MHK_003524 [Candidatus Magnetomorum sp. HK-1]|nr:hypothetical protein MHK_003524 [Candidatus Magnetomorum sp. HK-1]
MSGTQLWQRQAEGGVRKDNMDNKCECARMGYIKSYGIVRAGYDKNETIS